MTISQAVEDHSRLIHSQRSNKFVNPFKTSRVASEVHVVNI